MSGMRDHMMLYLVAPTPARVFRGNELLNQSKAQIRAELAHTDYIWLPEVYDEYDRVVESKISRIGAFRMIKVIHGETIAFEPVDDMSQLPKR